MGRPIVLFLCTGNSCRSQMAEGWLHSKAGGLFEAHSAGTRPVDDVHPLAVQVMNEVGIDISDRRPKPVKEYLGRLPVRHLIIVCHGADQECPRIWPGVLTREHWPIEDPASFIGTESEMLSAFREARDEIGNRVQEWVQRSRVAAAR